MSKITRVTQQPFGTLGPTGDFGAFGSKAVNPSSPIFTQNPATIQSLAPFSEGWGQAIIGNYEPPMEDMNGLFLLIFYQIGYLLQMGLAEYDAGTTYYISSRCQFNGVSYVSLQNNNTGNEPDTNSAYWQCTSANVFGGNVASASSVTLPNIGNSFKITGTTSINNITIQSAGIIIELIFTGALTVNTGGNILLNEGALTTVANNTLTLISDGTNWFELSRSTVADTFGTPVSQSTNTPYLAATNGFAYGNLSMQVASNTADATFYTSLNSNPEISPTASIEILFSTNNTASQNLASFCFPVARGEYYMLATGPNISGATMYFRSS